MEFPSDTPNEAKWRKIIYKADDYYQEGQRIGQAYFNALYDVEPEIADQLRGTDFDCFHEDSNLVGFLFEAERLSGESLRDS